MKRQTFLTIAAVVGALPAVLMITAPAKMMERMGSQPNDTTNVLLQILGAMIFSVSVTLFLARKDEGSIALRAIIIGNIIVDIGSIPIDWIAYQRGIFTQLSSLIPSTITHIIFVIGFIYYLMNLSKK
jgi:hypothetical protein